MSSIWFWSDLHLGHENIVAGVSKWENKLACRPFKTLKEHDETIINSINKYVKKNDVLYLLGDFSMGGRENVYKYRKMINCDNIHFVLGNHDIHIRKNAIIGKHGDSPGIPAQKLFTSVQERIIKKIGKQSFVMDHYAARTWDKGHHGAIQLHGHSHNSLPPYEKLLQIADDKVLYKTGDYFKQMDVGVEASYELTGEYRPFHIGEIRDIMENRINLGADRHE